VTQILTNVRDEVQDLFGNFGADVTPTEAKTLNRRSSPSGGRTCVQEPLVRIVIDTTYRETDDVFSPELKKGSSEMLILSLLEARQRQGYEIGKLIEARSGGRLTFALPTLYPTLLRLENRRWIKGRWVEKPGERRRCFYRLTPEGRRILAEQRKTWEDFIGAVKAVMGTSHA
jgi:PadR family transcriptional regulator, regulatory protein PadR